MRELPFVSVLRDGRSRPLRTRNTPDLSVYIMENLGAPIVAESMTQSISLRRSRLKTRDSNIGAN